MLEDIELNLPETTSTVFLQLLTIKEIFTDDNIHDIFVHFVNRNTKINISNINYVLTYLVIKLMQIQMFKTNAKAIEPLCYPLLCKVL